jgi:hypothetical protein
MEISQDKGVELIFTVNDVVENYEMAVSLLSGRRIFNFIVGLPKNAALISLFSNFIHYWKPTVPAHLDLYHRNRNRHCPFWQKVY